mgnify:CR=1 FL=1
MKRYLHFCTTDTTVDNDDQGGDIVYPVSAFRGMCSGLGAADGDFSGSTTKFTMLFDPPGVDGGGGDSEVGDNNVNPVAVTIKTANGQKDVMKKIIQKIHSARRTNDGWITIYDGLSRYPNLDGDIDGLQVAWTSND